MIVFIKAKRSVGLRTVPKGPQVFSMQFSYRRAQPTRSTPPLLERHSHIPWGVLSGARGPGSCLCFMGGPCQLPLRHTQYQLYPDVLSISLKTSSLTRELFRSVSCSFQTSVNFPDLFLLQIFSLIPLWSENPFCVISILLTLLRFALWLMSVGECSMCT